MKKIAFALITLLSIIACTDQNEDDFTGSVPEARDFKQDMRDFVIGISQKAKATDADFFIIPQNGMELVTANGEEDGTPASAYLEAIDGNGQEDLFYGYDNDNETTNAGDTAYIKMFIDISKNAGKKILVTDYCSTPAKMDSSYQVNNAAGYISFSAPERSLNTIPQQTVYHENANDITVLSQAQNFIYLINPENFTSKAAFITAVTATNYDAVIMDLFLEDQQFTASEINQLCNKANGGKRLVICYLSIGEAEDYRYYWSSSWNSSNPGFLENENPDWPGNYKVQYWNEQWQGIIYKNNDSYLSKIQAAGFDGVYLDIIDAFEYFEN